MSVVLRVLTPDAQARSAAVPLPLRAAECTGDSYTCLCAEHTSERLISLKRGSRDKTQPWMSRRAA